MTSLNCLAALTRHLRESCSPNNNKRFFYSSVSKPQALEETQLMRSSAQAATMAAASGFERLPEALHLQILSLLPLVTRARCALVSRTWSALLANPFLWTELRFDGAPSGAIDEETLFQICRRAGGRLRVLDVTSPASSAVSTEAIVRILASEGLGSVLESLSVASVTGAEAVALVNSCPMLTSVSTSVKGSIDLCSETLRALPAKGRKAVCFSDPQHGLLNQPPHPEDDVASARRNLFSVWDSRRGGEPPIDATFIVDQKLEAVFAGAEGERAAARLGVAFAEPGRGLCKLTGFSGEDRAAAAPLFVSVCRALSGDSPLLQLVWMRCPVGGAGAAEIAAALAPGRSRLQTLALCSKVDDDLSAGGGRARGLLLCSHLFGPSARTGDHSS